MSELRARKIKLILFDVDGVLTDGSIWLFPPNAASPPAKEAGPQEGATVTQNMVEVKGFHTHDGTGFWLARLAGLQTGLVTSRCSETVKLRARDLRIDHVLQGISDKHTAFQKLLQKTGLAADEVAFAGDDLVDLPVMRECGLAITVPNAREDVKDEAHLITDRPGGQGAGRDAIEYILRAQNKLDAAKEAYLRRA
jgi:3-deoxy-D-manno-octulosonate 8-phosphate phosphatase (KDO 8-P phosphatase)